MRFFLGMNFFFKKSSKVLLHISATLLLLGCRSQSQVDTYFLSGQNGCMAVDNSSNASGFGGATLNGVAWSSAPDGLGNNNYIKLSTSTNNSELDSSWAPAWSNIVGLWHLDETAGGSAADSSGSGSKAMTVAGAVTQGISGKLLGASSFDGSTGYLYATTSSTSPSVFSIQAWFNTTTTAGGTIFGFTSSQTGGSYAYDRSINMNSNGTVFFYLYPYVATSALSYNDGNWHLATATYSSSSGSLYIDAALVATLSGSSGQIYGGYWRIGDATGLASSYFAGKIDEVVAWSTPLTAPQVQTIYNRQSAKYSGTFQSRIDDSYIYGPGWKSFGWTSTLPFGKELPDSSSSAPVSESLSKYSSMSSGSLMSGIAGLWHLDEPAGTGTARDASGSGNNGIVNGGVTLGQAGKLNTSGFFNGASAGTVSFSNPITTSTSNVTLAGWAYLSSNSLAGAFIKLGDCGVGYGIGVGNSTFETTGNNLVVIYENRRWISAGAMRIGWHHFALSLNASGNPTMYLDGNQIYTDAAGGPIAPNNVQAIGGYSATACGFGNRYFTGPLDEIAIWNRALSSAEILQLYRRGANRIKYQVRSCSDSTCAANPIWLGPDVTNQTYFSELNNNAIPIDGGDVTANDSVLPGLPSMLFSSFGSLSAPANRYFQYRSILESDDTGTGCNYGAGATWCSPELQSVTVKTSCSN